MLRLCNVVLLIALVTGCQNKSGILNEEAISLNKFAQVNCLFQYFELNNYETKDIRAIAGGIVETSDISIDKFQEIALFISNFDHNTETKQNIDKNLLKCFSLERNLELQKIIAR